MCTSSCPFGDTRKDVARNEVGERLRKLRLRHQMTLKGVAERTGLSVSFLSSLKRGHTGASIASLRAVISVFDIDWREFFDAEPREVPAGRAGG